MLKWAESEQISKRNSFHTGTNLQQNWFCTSPTEPLSPIWPDVLPDNRLAMCRRICLCRAPRSTYRSRRPHTSTAISTTTPRPPPLPLVVECCVGAGLTRNLLNRNKLQVLSAQPISHVKSQRMRRPGIWWNCCSQEKSICLAFSASDRPSIHSFIHPSNSASVPSSIRPLVHLSLHPSIY